MRGYIADIGIAWWLMHIPAMMHYPVMDGTPGHEPTLLEPDPGKARALKYMVKARARARGLVPRHNSEKGEDLPAAAQDQDVQYTLTQGLGFLEFG